MTRRDYEMIAMVLRDNRPDELSKCYEHWKVIVNAMTASLKFTNPMFNPEMFKKACKK